MRLGPAPDPYCSASPGVTQVDSATANSGEAIERADRALYLAKETGRNCVRVHEGRALLRLA